MEALEAILSRRSIRKYQNKAVSEEQVNKLLEAAMSAPSAHNQQPWHFVVLNDHKVMDEIPKFHQYAKMIPEAALSIVVCGDTGKADGFWVQDCSAAIQNMLVAARGMGLGSVWLGVYPRENLCQSMKELVGLPENITPLGIVVVGHPAEEKPPSNRFSAARVHYNNWCQTIG